MAQTSGAARDYAVPETDEQEIALERALAGARKKKLEGVKAFLETPHMKKVREDLDALAKTRLPEGYAAKMNVANLQSFLETMTRSIGDELRSVENVINPPEQAPDAPGEEVADAPA